MDLNTQVSVPNSDKNDHTFNLGPPSHTSTGTLSIVSASPRAKTDTSSPYVSDKVKGNVSEQSPDGKRCLITRDTEQLHCCHVIQPTKLSSLAVAWGCIAEDIQINGSLNLLWLRRDICGRFEDFDWALVPQLDVLEDILIAECERGDGPLSEHYLEFFEPKIWEYHFVPFRPSPRFLVRFGNGLDDYNARKYPFLDLKPLKSHVNPLFVVYDAGRKVRYHRQKKEKEPHSDTSVLPEYENRLDLCDRIYDRWKEQILRSQPSETLSALAV